MIAGGVSITNAVPTVVLQINVFAQTCPFMWQKATRDRM